LQARQVRIEEPLDFLTGVLCPLLAYAVPLISPRRETGSVGVGTIFPHANRSGKAMMFLIWLPQSLPQRMKISGWRMTGLSVRNRCGSIQRSMALAVLNFCPRCPYTPRQIQATRVANEKISCR